MGTRSAVMPMRDLHLALVVLLWAAAAVRSPAIRQEPWRRALWILITALAASMTLRIPTVADRINDFADAPGLATMLSHLAGVGTVLALAAWTQALKAESGRSRLLAVQAIAACVTSSVMIAMFVSLPTGTPDAFLDGASGRTQATVYYLSFALYLAGSMTVSSHTLWRLRRRSERGATHVGLMLLASGLAVGVVDALGRAAFMIEGAGAEPARGTPEAMAVDTVGLASMMLIVAGCSVPIAGALAWRLRGLHTLWMITPLRRDLVATHPGVAFPVPSHTVRTCTARKLLLRHTIECRDIMIQLRAYVRAQDVEDARSALTARGLPMRRLDAATEAAWLRVAVTRFSAGAQPGPIAGFPAPGGQSMAQDTAWLKKISSAYRRHDVRAVAMALVNREPTALGLDAR